mgnify:CR=1 FL=1
MVGVLACSSQESSPLASASSAPDPPALITFAVRDDLVPTSFVPGPAFAHVVELYDKRLEVARVIIFNDGASDATCRSFLKLGASAGGTGVAVEINAGLRNNRYAEYGADGEGAALTFGKPVELNGGFCAFVPKVGDQPAGRSTGNCLFGKGSERTAVLTETTKDWVSGELVFEANAELRGVHEKPVYLRGKFKAKTCLFESKKEYLELSRARLAVSPADDAAIRSAVSDYQFAVLAKNGKAVDRVLDSKTKAFLDKARRSALTASAAQVRSMELEEKYFVLFLRATQTAAGLAQMSPGEVMLALPETARLSIEPTALANIDRIEGDGDEAKIWAGTGSITLGVMARHEQDGWKLEVLGPGMGLLLAADGMSDRSRSKLEDRLMEKITKLSAKPVDKLWDPPAR